MLLTVPNDESDYQDWAPTSSVRLICRCMMDTGSVLCNAMAPHFLLPLCQSNTEGAAGAIEKGTARVRTYNYHVSSTNKVQQEYEEVAVEQLSLLMECGARWTCCP